MMAGCALIALALAILALRLGAPPSETLDLVLPKEYILAKGDDPRED